MQTTPNFNLDRSFFTVVSQLPSGSITQPEIDPFWSRQTVLEMAKQGQFDTVLHIIECNPVEDTSRVIPASEIDDELEVERISTARRQPYLGPNHEHMIGNFEAGVGAFGPYNGRAA